MSLLEQIQDEIKTAMKSKDVERLGALRLIKTDLAKAELDQGKALTADAEIAVLKKMVKQRRDSIEQFTQGGRTELAAKEIAELKIIETFLPAGLSDAEMEAIVDAAFAEMGEIPAGISPGAITGKVMGKLKAAGKPFDGKRASELVNARLKR